LKSIPLQGWIELAYFLAAKVGAKHSEGKSRWISAVGELFYEIGVVAVVPIRAVSVGVEILKKTETF